MLCAAHVGPRACPVLHKSYAIALLGEDEDDSSKGTKGEQQEPGSIKFKFRSHY